MTPKGCDELKSVSPEYRLLNYVFENEKEILAAVVENFVHGHSLNGVNTDTWLKVINETYHVARRKNNVIYEVACRRFRKKESYIRTCINLMISPAKYYRVLRIFFKLAQRTLEKYFET